MLYLLMRKLIRQYEEKNRIIQEIQKNLRMVSLKSPRPQLANKPKPSPLTFKLDLPTINVRHEYSPRSVNDFNDKKYSSVSGSTGSKQLPEEKSVRKSEKSWIKTISFRNQGESQIKPVILVNHRTTLRNFMRSTSRSLNQSSEKNQNQMQKQIFLSTSKFMLSKQDSKILGQQIPQKQSAPSQETLKGSPQKKKKPFSFDNDQDSTHFRHSQQVIQQIMSTQLSKKQKQKQKQKLKQKLKSPQMQQEIDFRTINTTILSPNRYYRSKKKTSRNKRSCSPWNSERESEEINQIWNTHNHL